MKSVEKKTPSIGVGALNFNCSYPMTRINSYKFKSITLSLTCVIDNHYLFEYLYSRGGISAA
jgi:hypothetical protein